MGKRRANFNANGSSFTSSSQPVEMELESPRKSTRLSQRSKEYEEIIVGKQKKRPTASQTSDLETSLPSRPSSVNQPDMTVESLIVNMPKKRERKTTMMTTHEVAEAPVEATSSRRHSLSPQPSSSLPESQKHSPIKSNLNESSLSMVKSKRGRPKGSTKVTRGKVVAQKVSRKEPNRIFKCSACTLEFELESKGKRHLHTEHYGLALLNQPHPAVFTDSERIKAYTNTLKVISYIDCAKCGKRFRSGLGLKLHESICGKSDEERNVNCAICGKVLKESSMKSHARTHLIKESLQEGAGGLSTAMTNPITSPLDSDSTAKLINLDGPVQLFDTSVGRPVRSSARKAMELFAESNQDSEDELISMEENEPGKKKSGEKSLRESRKLDYEMSFSEDSMAGSESDEQGEDSEDMSENGFDQEEEEEKENAENDRFYDYSREIEQIASFDSDEHDEFVYLFNRWRDYFETFYENQRQWPETEDDEFVDKCKYYGFLRCPLKCKQLFENVEQLKLHYTQCGFVACCKCKFCEQKGDHKRELLTHLFRNHAEQLPRIHIKKQMPKQGRSRPQSFRPVTISKFLSNATYNFNDFVNRHYVDKVFLDWQPRADQFSKVQSSRMDSFLPQHRQSPSFRCLKRTRALSKPSTETKQWKRLDLFEHHIENSHITIFTGGPVYSGAWCPFPVDKSKEPKSTTAKLQVLCVATLSEQVENNYTSLKAVGHRGLLQFWSFDSLNYDRTTPNCDPKLSFAIAHNFGVVWDMAWCPGGTAFCEREAQTNRSEDWSRLGLLAIACGDGHIRILRIPFPDDLQRHFKTNQRHETSPIIVYCRPIVVLQSPQKCPSLLDSEVICRSLSWCQTDNQRKIVAGYGNGLIAVFDLANNSPLLLTTDRVNGMHMLQAQRCWIGHGAIVNSVKWLPYQNCEYLLSGSFDRCLKFWDLKNLC